MRAATEGSLPPVMPQGNLVEVLGREVRQGSPGELMVESSPSRQRRPPCKTNKKMSYEAADAAVLTYLLTVPTCKGRRGDTRKETQREKNETRKTRSRAAGKPETGEHKAGTQQSPEPEMCALLLTIPASHCSRAAAPMTRL